MESIKEIFKIGFGPSSSHTMGPHKAATIFREKHPECRQFKVTLYGSLAATGKGHLTDTAILSAFSSDTSAEYSMKYLFVLRLHPILIPNTSSTASR